MSTLAFFYHPELSDTQAPFALTEETARHVVQVLRKNTGDMLLLTDGRGKAAEVTITETGKKKCMVQIARVTHHKPASPALHMAICFTKNTSRNEWLLEKVTEMGIQNIIPIIAKRSEKERIRFDRWQNILISAMLQSQQYYLPVLHEPTEFDAVIANYSQTAQKLIAHCIEDQERHSINNVLMPQKDTIIFIGPEGDFAPEEVAAAQANGYTAISMGSTRLRTETAAMSACSFFNMVNA